MPNWQAPLDPSEYKDYVADWTPVMAEASDNIASAQVNLSAEAVLAGLEIDETVNPPVIDGHEVRVWFRVDPSAGASPLFDGDGAVFGVEVTVTTTAGRTLQRTWDLTVRQL